MKKGEKKFFLGLVVVALLFLFLLVLVLVFSLEIPILGGAVGVVPVKGEMYTESTSSIVGSSFGVRETIKQLKNADENPSVSAILLDINSPGGSVVAGQELARAIKKTKKPVVAYIGELGASSAYLTASAADEIVADPHSLTGSIGSVIMITNYAELLEKIGVNITTISGGDNKAMLSPYEEIDPAHKAMMQEIIDDAYLDFKSQVLDNRRGKTSEEQLDLVADGRILSGNQALEAGLIDHVGSRDLALERVAALGGIEGEPVEILYTPSRSPFAGIFSEIGFQLGSGFLSGLKSDGVELKS
ncbi:signal peptide peptidase SppA [archaeon]|nr:signal peptide peptidase SppA [archaeon]